MDFEILKTEIWCFKKEVNDFINSLNTGSLDFSPKEISDISFTIQKLSIICEACHNNLSLLSTEKPFNDDNHIQTELLRLTKDFEHARRKFEIRMLVKKLMGSNNS